MLKMSVGKKSKKPRSSVAVKVQRPTSTETETELPSHNQDTTTKPKTVIINEAPVMDDDTDDVVEEDSRAAAREEAEEARAAAREEAEEAAEARATAREEAAARTETQAEAKAQAEAEAQAIAEARAEADARAEAEEETFDDDDDDYFYEYEEYEDDEEEDKDKDIPPELLAAGLAVGAAAGAGYKKSKRKKLRRVKKRKKTTTTRPTASLKTNSSTTNTTATIAEPVTYGTAEANTESTEAPPEKDNKTASRVAGVLIIIFMIIVYSNRGKETDPTSEAPPATAPNTSNLQLQNDSFTFINQDKVILSTTALLKNDPKYNAGQITKVGNARNGEVILNNTEISFTPAINLVEKGQFDYTVTDKTGATAQATVILHFNMPVTPQTSMTQASTEKLAVTKTPEPPKAAEGKSDPCVTLGINCKE